MILKKFIPLSPDLVLVNDCNKVLCKGKIVWMLKYLFLGDGIDSATVISILVSPGEDIAIDDTIVELETDKATAPVPSTVAGKLLTLHVKEGDTVKQGMLVASIESDGSAEDSPQEETPVSTQEPVQPVPNQVVPQVETPAVQVTPSSMSYQFTSSTGAPPPTSPSIRKLASRIGLDLGRIQGSGNGGRITEEDVKKHVLMLQARAFSPVEQPANASSQNNDQPSISHKPLPDFSKFGPVRKEALTSLRQKIATNLYSAWNRIPHVTQFHDADISDLMALRKTAVKEYEKKNARLTVTVFLLKAIVATLKKHPIFNASYDDINEEIVFKDYYHIGMAVDTDNGLIVPVIRDVDKRVC